MTATRQRCGSCRYWHDHGAVLCTVCASDVEVQLITDADIEARFKARRAEYKAKQAAKQDRVREQVRMSKAFSPTV